MSQLWSLKAQDQAIPFNQPYGEYHGWSAQDRRDHVARQEAREQLRVRFILS
jgi:hypothetical protein